MLGSSIGNISLVINLSETLPNLYDSLGNIALNLAKCFSLENTWV